MVREVMDEYGEWETVEGDGDVVPCAVCDKPIWWQSCPTGGWWVHAKHPDDHHDGVG